MNGAIHELSAEGLVYMRGSSKSEALAECVCLCGHHFQKTGYQPDMAVNPARMNRYRGISFPPVPVRA